MYSDIFNLQIIPNPVLGMMAQSETGVLFGASAGYGIDAGSTGPEGFGVTSYKAVGE